MRLHYVLNHGGTPESKLADVEIHFEDGPFRIRVGDFFLRYNGFRRNAIRPGGWNDD
jgi:hypothetical protein